MIILFKRSFWTRNRLSILIPWMTPLALSVVLSFFNLPLAFMAFFILSVIARIVVVKRSPFADMMREDFEDKMKEEEIVLDNGLVLKTADIKKTKKALRLLKIASLIFSLVLMRFFKELPDIALGWLFLSTWFFFSQALSKSYLITKDSPLNGFPFFRSRNTGKRNSISEPYNFHPSVDITSPQYLSSSLNPTSPLNINNR